LNATHGDIFFNGRNITRLAPHRICHLGICRTFQIVQSFAPPDLPPGHLSDVPNRAEL